MNQIDPDALRRVEELFWTHLEQGLHPGAALAVYYNGALVLDLWGGMADTAQGIPVARDTMFVLYSSTKPLAAMAVWVLIERGTLDLDTPIVNYWPEFGRNGKAAVTVRHILTHRGGFPDWPSILTWEQLGDWDAVVQGMEQATAKYPPGEVMAYHSFNFGWVLGELVRRIDGRSFSEFLRQEIAEPLGMPDTYVGLPPGLFPRVSRVWAMDDIEEEQRIFPEKFNQPEILEAIIPASSGVATSRDMARFYAALVAGGGLDGRRVWSATTVERATAVAGPDELDRTFDVISRRSLGFNLGGAPFSERMGAHATARTFGYFGAGTSVCWGDPDLGLAMAYLPNGYRGRDVMVMRNRTMSDAIRTIAAPARQSTRRSYLG
jgi:CubicO group peptidase (beta-lactamase class C family)